MLGTSFLTMINLMFLKLYSVSIALDGRNFVTCEADMYFEDEKGYQSPKRGASLGLKLKLFMVIKVVSINLLRGELVWDKTQKKRKTKMTEGINLLREELVWDLKPLRQSKSLWKYQSPRLGASL